MLSFIFNLSLLLMKPSRGCKITKLSLTRHQCLTSFYVYINTFKKGKEKNQLPSLVFQFMNELNTISLPSGRICTCFQFCPSINEVQHIPVYVSLYIYVNTSVR